MTFKEVLAQVIDWLQQDKRISYRALKRQFDLDDDYLEDLKDGLLFAHPVVDEDGRGLVWTGEADPPSESDVQRETDIEVRFHAILHVLTGLLQREGRLTYRELKHVFGIDDALLDEIREALTLKQLAIDEGNKVLAWTGEAIPVAQPVISTPSPSAALEAAETNPSAMPEPIRNTPDAERRQLTVMFCDLADSTKLSQQLDPEDLREVIRAYQETAAEVIHQFEGHMAQYLGDGLLIYFGWPVAHEDDAQRAMHVGLGIVDAITSSLNPRLQQEKGVQLAVRLGIHTGPVVVGEMGGGGRHENLATGETVNIAARLEGLAAPNTLMISNVTARMVRDAFELEDLGQQVLKGVAEPMEVFRVIRPLDTDRDDEEGLPGEGMFLVGRDEEVGLLMRRWEQAKERLGQVVLISGEAGIGKSSLVATMRRHAVQEEHTRMTFRCSPYHTNSALYPVIEHLQRVLQFQPGDTPATRLDKLEHVLNGYSRPLEEVVPLFADLLSIPISEGRYPALSLPPQQQRQQTQDALVGWLLEEAERQPTLAMWEDLHWADPSTLEMLGLVLEQMPTVPMLNVLTFRPEFEPSWSTRSHMTPITLNRLERPQVEALIMHLVGGKALPAEVAEYIVVKTDGVPLYVEELTKMLLESDLLHEEAEQYVLTGPLLTLAIPDTLQDSLMARLDQMHTAKEVAQLGAVLGREFPYEMLQAISSQDEETLQAGLAQLVEGELLYQRGRPPRARYIFKHALIQDAAYASLLKSTRQRVHQQIAQALATRFAETAGNQPELVAHHYTEAAFNEQAVEYWRKAGQRAIERSAHREAISHLAKGIELLMTLSDTSERIQQELTLQTILGQALIAAKGYAAPDVERAYARARELCQHVGDTSQRFLVLRGLQIFYMVQGKLQTARELGEQLLNLAQCQHDPTLLVGAHLSLGQTLWFLGEPAAAREHLEQGQALYDPQQHRFSDWSGGNPGVQCHLYGSLALWLLGYPEQALQQSPETLMLARRLSQPYSLVLALCLDAIFHQFRQDELAVLERAEAAVTLSTEQGFTFFSAFSTLLRGWAFTARGQREEGLTQIRQGLTDHRASGAEAIVPYFLALLAEGYGNPKQIDEGLDALKEGLEVMERTGERWWEAEVHRLKGELLLHQATSDVAQAETCFHQALDVARYQQAKSLELRAATSLARLWQSQDKRQGARDLLAPVYEWFTEGFDTADLIEAKGLLDELGG
ncbi:MAG: AAA family ATPase [bacterium]|nr:AAA family ATPase [bacterium]